MKTAPITTSRERTPQAPFLTAKHLCAELDITPAALYVWRQQGMPYIPLGTRAVRYNLQDVLEWLEARKKDYTANKAAWVKGEKHGIETF